MSAAAARYILSKICETYEDRTSRRRHKRDNDSKERRGKKKGIKNKVKHAGSELVFHAGRKYRKAKDKKEKVKWLASRRIAFGPYLDGDVFAAWWFQYEAPGSPNAHAFTTFAKHAKRLATGGDVEMVRRPFGVPNAPWGGMTDAIERECNEAFEKGVFAVVKGTKQEFSTFMKKMEYGGFVIMVKSSDGKRIQGKIRIFDSSHVLRSILGNAERKNRFNMVAAGIEDTLEADNWECDHFTGYFDAFAKNGHLVKFPHNDLGPTIDRRIAVLLDAVQVPGATGGAGSGSGTTTTTTASSAASARRKGKQRARRVRSASFSYSTPSSSPASGGGATTSASASGSGSGSGSYSFHG